MIVVQPETYTKTGFDSELIGALAQRALENVAALPDDLDVQINVDENAATNRVRVSSLDPVVLAVDSGALENYKAPRTVGDLASSITFTRLFLEVTDLQSESFGAPPLDEAPNRAHRMAWDVNLFGRAARHGLHIHIPRYRYNFRNRHGFTDRADRVFEQLWNGDELTYEQIVALSDSVTDVVV